MKYGLIGEKLGHSLSKKIYEFCGYNYSLLEVEKQNLQDVIKNKTLTNFNVTIPYKQDIMPYLDYISNEALSIGAVNTVMYKNERTIDIGKAEIRAFFQKIFKAHVRLSTCIFRIKTIISAFLTGQK